MARGLVVLFAVACGLAAANLYYAQPVLDHIARSYGADSATAGLVVTFSQVGYASASPCWSRWVTSWCAAAWCPRPSRSPPLPSWPRPSLRTSGS